MDGENDTKTIVYNTKWDSRKEGRKKEKREKERKVEERQQ